jgi:hypothetical protein
MKMMTKLMIAGAIAVAGTGTTSVKADGGPAGYCAPIPLHNAWAAPGTCISMPWGSLRCLAGSPQGTWMNYMSGCSR